MMKNIENIDELLVKYWGGSANEEDKEQLLIWLKANENNGHYFNKSFDLWIASVPANRAQSEVAFERFKSSINLEETVVPVKKLNLRYYASRIAAACVLAVLGYFVVQHTDFWKKEVYVQEVIMPHGNKGKVSLPDGTMVWLNSDTKITYPKEFSNSKREVAIEGQAYFEVATDQQRPFFLTADNVSVKVLGTKFDVQNYSSKSEINVVLIEGSISVSDDKYKKGKLLSPNERYTYSKVSKENHIDKTNAVFSNVWIKDKLTFENKKLADIIPYLENWFGIAVVCEKDLAENTRLTFTVRQDSLEDILQSIEYISTLHFEIKDNTIYIN